MKTKKLTLPDGIRFDIPPENAGQIVEVAYGEWDGVIYRRVHDRSDRTTEIVAYEPPEDSAEGECQPWNEEPRLGRRLGKVEAA